MKNAGINDDLIFYFPVLAQDISLNVLEILYLI